jgi:putative tricarboxylic transport membrane protein
VLARAVPLVLLAAGGVYLILALRLPFGAAARPGAGFYPVIVAVFAIIVALAATASAFRSASGAEAVELDAASRRRVVISVVTLVAFCLVLPWVGYPAAAFAFVAVVLRYLGARWATALLTGALSSAGSYGLFAVLLDVPLPRGLW